MPSEKKSGDAGYKLDPEIVEQLNKAARAIASRSAPRQPAVPSGSALAAPAAKASGAESTRLLAEAYQAATEQINPLIARAEKALASLRLGVSAEITLDEDLSFSMETRLRFSKFEKEWGLSIVTGPIGVSDSDSWEPARLHTTSRELRLKALALLPALEKKLVETAESQFRSAAATLTQAEAFIAQLEAKGAK